MSVNQTGLLVTIEEGSAFGGLGGEIIAQVSEYTWPLRVARIAADAVPVPSVREVEAEVLPSRPRIVKVVRGLVEHAGIPVGNHGALGAVRTA